MTQVFQNPNSSMVPPKNTSSDMTSQDTTTKPSNMNPVASRFTRGFLRALMRINRPRPRPSRSTPSQRRRRVRIAADASMAFAVGPRRAWSRALLSKTRTRHLARTRGHGGLGDKIRKKRTARVCRGEKKKKTTNTKELQRLVPGGEAMDVCSLLDETAHYIECLTTQVQVMKTIATLFSS